MRRRRLGEAVLSPGQLRAADGTAVCLGVAAVVSLVALFTAPVAAPILLFLGLAAVRPLETACQSSPGWTRNLMTNYCVLLAVAALTILSIVGGCDRAGWDQATVAVAFWGAFASLWSAQLGRILEKRITGKTG
jgi:hypothetical protein